MAKVKLGNVDISGLNSRISDVIPTLNDTYLLVGVVDEEETVPDKNFTYADLLSAHAHDHYTADNSAVPNKFVPARPLIRNSVERFGVLWKRELKKELKSMFYNGYSKRNLIKSYAAIGELASESMKKTFSIKYLTPNSDSTAANKGFNKPLFYTGGLYDAITYEVKRGKK